MGKKRILMAWWLSRAYTRFCSKIYHHAITVLNLAPACVLLGVGAAAPCSQEGRGPKAAAKLGVSGRSHKTIGMIKSQGNVKKAELQTPPASQEKKDEACQQVHCCIA